MVTSKTIHLNQEFELADREEGAYIEHLQEKMSDLNKWLGIGRLIADPQSRPSGAGPITTFTIAINERWRRGSEATGSTTFVPIVATGNLGESAAKFLRKGRQVMVEGKLQIEQYEDKDHGKHQRPSIRAENIQFLWQDSGEETPVEAAPSRTRTP